MGRKPSAHYSLEERVDLSCACTRISPSQRDILYVAERHDGWPRDAPEQSEPRSEAVRHLGPSHRPEGDAAVQQRRRQRCRLDSKYGLSKSLTLDLTYNTDFAQVEDDTQQVNLTRFNQFFPERREFFLEGQGLFTFGGANGTGGEHAGLVLQPAHRFEQWPADPDCRRRPPDRATGQKLFRLAQHSGPRRHAIAIARDEFLRASAQTRCAGTEQHRVLYTRRDETTSGGAPTGQTFGVDGLYSLSPSLNVTAYYARTEKSGVQNGNGSYLTRFDYNTDRYGLQVERLTVGERFNPEVGFLRRNDLDSELCTGAIQSAAGAKGHDESGSAVRLSDERRVHRKQRRTHRLARADRTVRRSSFSTATG